MWQVYNNVRRYQALFKWNKIFYVTGTFIRQKLKKHSTKKKVH
jgi:hypothetical protein